MTCRVEINEQISVVNCLGIMHCKNSVISIRTFPKALLRDFPRLQFGNNEREVQNFQNGNEKFRCEFIHPTDVVW